MTSCDDLDLATRTASPEQLGTRHPLSVVRNEILRIFAGMGFTIAEGPEIEDDWHVFESLNFPPDHPARDMRDTFFVSRDPSEVLLRTHTSSVQTRVMEHKQPPSASCARDASTVTKPYPRVRTASSIRWRDCISTAMCRLSISSRFFSDLPPACSARIPRSVSVPHIFHLPNHPPRWTYHATSAVAKAARSAREPDGLRFRMRYGGPQRAESMWYRPRDLHRLRLRYGELSGSPT